MPNSAGTRVVLGRYLKAAIPFIAVRTSERSRVLPILRQLARTMQVDVSVHTLTRGVYNLATGDQVSVDKSLWSALEYAGDQFQKRNRLTVVFTDVQRISDDNEETRHLLDLILAAEQRECSVVVITADPVWAALQQYGMTVVLDRPDYDETLQLARDVLEPSRGKPGYRFEWGEDEYREAASVLRGVSQTQAVNLLSILLADRSVTRADLPKLSLAKDAVFSDLAGIERIAVHETDVDVAGLAGLNTWLTQRRRLLTMDLRDRGSSPPRGVLLVGVPGCGKSLSAKAVSVRWQLPLYRLDMASILGMWVGQSEGRLRTALEMADRVAPCVLWIDEIEKGLAGVGTESSGVTTRLVGQFLFWLQESKSGAFVVATANNVAALPPELLRRGRFDATFFVDLPDPAERREIIRLYVKRYLKTAADEDLTAELVALSEGFSGAEIDSAVKEVMNGTLVGPRAGSEPTRQDYQDAFRDVIPFSRAHPEALENLRAIRSRTLPASGGTPGARPAPADRDPGRGAFRSTLGL
jgi:ATPase family associated with various cellular activities (AAA)